MRLLIFFRPAIYLDPGTGSLLIQLILAGLLGIGVVVRIFWDKIKGLFIKDKPFDAEQDDPTALPFEDNDSL